MTEWTGRALAEDLASQLRSDQWMVWVEMPLGSVMHSNPQRADVLAINKSYTNTLVKIYEVKVTLADFRGDVLAKSMPDISNQPTKCYSLSRKD